MMPRLMTTHPARKPSSGKAIRFVSLLSFPLLLNLAGCSKDEGEYYESRTSAADPAPAVTASAEADSGALPAGHPPLTMPTGELPEGHPPMDLSGVQLPEGHPSLEDMPLSPPGTMDMAGQTLPDELIAQGDLPRWEVPEGWEETAPRPMRRANFSLGKTGLEVAVTSFPGNVGGMPANVNRWRRQLGLPPVAESDMLPFLTQTSVDGKDVLLVDLLGPPQPDDQPTQRMITAVANHAGATWFFKLTGDAPKVETHRPEFVQFILSLRFPEGAPAAPES